MKRCTAALLIAENAYLKYRLQFLHIFGGERKNFLFPILIRGGIEFFRFYGNYGYPGDERLW